LAWALTTFHTRLFPYPANLFVGVGRRVAFLAGLLVLPQLGIDIVPTSQETEKKGDLIVWSENRSGGDLTSENATWTVEVLVETIFETFSQRLEFCFYLFFPP
jgi:hypothetical protein